MNHMDVQGKCSWECLAGQEPSPLDGVRFYQGRKSTGRAYLTCTWAEGGISRARLLWSLWKPWFSLGPQTLGGEEKEILLC